MTPTTWNIEKTGYLFRAVNSAGVRSGPMSSASQAGLFIERKAGKDAHRAAFDAFVASL